MTENFKDQEKRIKSVFPKGLKNLSKQIKTIELYKAYLENNLTFPILLTGAEDFVWEEFYLFGPGDEKEFEELRKTRPSSQDTFNMVRLDEFYDEDYGLFAKVTRISDKKRFQIPLIDLKGIDEKTKNSQILDDYSYWFVNYG